MSVMSLKQHRTRIYRLIAGFYLSFPLASLPFFLFLLGIPLDRLPRILMHPFFWPLSMVAMITGLGLHEVRRWSWYLLHFTELYFVLLSAHFAFRYGQSPYPLVSFFVLVGFIWLGHRRLTQELRVPYFMPQIAWWESNPRYKTVLPAQVLREGGRTLDADILDLSLSGCFIKCKPEFQANEWIEIHCRLFSRDWKCRGTVVWNTFGAVTHPRGIGVKFGAMDRGTRRILRAATARLKRISELNRSGRYWMSSEEYERLSSKLNSPLPGGDA
ncbi:MAG: PilZ domain [Pseudomonadota bacterium]|jgi:hypothetical protein